MVNTTWTTCNVCGTDAFIPLSQVDGWQIGRCSYCKMIFVNPIPFFDPTPYFSEISRTFQYTEYMHKSITPTILEFERNQLQLQFEQAHRFAPELPAQGKLLEVGCGSGASVRAAVDLGWEATGLDIDPQLIQQGREQLEVDLRCIPVLEAGLEGERFNLIRMRDVIEHLPNPYEVLVELKRLLVPGGTLIIVTPNEEGLPSQMRLLVGRKRDRVATVPPPHHLHGFSPDTLRLILNRVGLTPLHITTSTPVNPMYVTSNNMRSANRVALKMMWEIAQRMGKGSVLVGWAAKK